MQSLLVSALCCVVSADMLDDVRAIDSGAYETQKTGKSDISALIAGMRTGSAAKAPSAAQPHDLTPLQVKLANLEAKAPSAAQPNDPKSLRDKLAKLESMKKTLAKLKQLKQQKETTDKTGAFASWNNVAKSTSGAGDVMATEKAQLMKAALKAIGAPAPAPAAMQSPLFPAAPAAVPAPAAPQANSNASPPALDELLAAKSDQAAPSVPSPPSLPPSTDISALEGLTSDQLNTVIALVKAAQSKPAAPSTPAAASPSPAAANSPALANVLQGLTGTTSGDEEVKGSDPDMMSLLNDARGYEVSSEPAQVTSPLNFLSFGGFVVGASLAGLVVLMNRPVRHDDRQLLSPEV
jgi:hypothetical protein